MDYFENDDVIEVTGDKIVDILNDLISTGNFKNLHVNQVMFDLSSTNVNHSTRFHSIVGDIRTIGASISIFRHSKYMLGIDTDEKFISMINAKFIHN